MECLKLIILALFLILFAFIFSSKRLKVWFYELQIEYMIMLACWSIYSFLLLLYWVFKP